MILPFATMVLALLFLGHHGVMVWEDVTAPASTAHTTVLSDGDHFGHAFEDMEAGHGNSSDAAHPDCASSNTGCLNAKTELGLPAPLPVSGVLIRPVPFRTPPLLAHSPLPEPPQLSELSILRI